MNSQDISFLAFGAVCTLLGTGTLYYSWRSKVQLKESFSLLGWILLGVAAMSWIGLSGWEFGTLYAITLPSLAALLFVSYNAEFSSHEIKPETKTSIKPPNAALTGRFLLKLVLILPFALVASLFVSYGISILSVVSELNQLVMAILILPVVWGFFVFWLLADTRIFRPAIAQGVLAAAFLVPVLQA